MRAPATKLSIWTASILLDDKTFCLQTVEAIPSSNNLFFAINKISNDHFNGKISDPCIFDDWLDDKECSLLENDISGEKIMKSAKFAWDFGQDISTQTVKDMTITGYCHNFPSEV